MARKSKLTPEQWQDVKRRHLVDGESIRSIVRWLADSLGIVVTEKAIRDYLKKDAEFGESTQSTQNSAKEGEGVKKQINNTAIAVIEALSASGLPKDDQGIALEVAARQINGREVLDDTAANMNTVANAVSKLAKQNAEKLKVGDEGFVDAEHLKQIMIMSQVVNSANATGIDLTKIDAMAKNKEVLPPAPNESPVKFYIPENGRK